MCLSCCRPPAPPSDSVACRTSSGAGAGHWCSCGSGAHHGGTAATGMHPPGVGHHVVRPGMHPPGVGHHHFVAPWPRHPPGVGHHPPGVGHHAPPTPPPSELLLGSLPPLFPTSLLPTPSGSPLPTYATDAGDAVTPPCATRCLRLPLSPSALSCPNEGPQPTWEHWGLGFTSL
eukprot:SM003226S12424  [mRNA]  locus=s3226:437:1343:+ [translate_table: standard]